MEPTMKPRHIALLLCATLLVATPAGAITMQQMFDQVNAYSNTTKPGAYEAQTMNLYTGGSLFMRTPQRTYQLASATPPSWGAGCGGIDIFAGGFTFINKEQFVALLRNIGSNAVGYAFKLALQNMCPSCDNILTSLQDAANKINRANINSCEMAQGVVNAATPDTWQKSQANLAKTFGSFANIFSDFTDAWANTAGDYGQAKNVLDQAKSNPDSQAKVTSGNVTWKALKKIPTLDDDTRNLFMSLIGAYIFDGSGSKPQVIVKPPTDITLANLIGMPGADNTQVNVYYCLNGDADECTAVGTYTYTQRAFVALVRERMQKISDSLRSGARNDADSAANIAFVNGTSIPVYKMLAVGSMLPNSAISDIMISRYEELIAAEYAATYIRAALTDISAAMAQLSADGSADQADAVSKLTTRASELRREVAQEMIKVYNGAVTANNVAMEIMQMERALYSSLPANLQQSLSWQKGMGG